MANLMDELLEQFVIEGRELVQVASDDLIALERDPTDAARIDSVFRAIHTLKGSVGLFDLAPMSAAMHAAEDLIGALRDGSRPADRTTIDALLDCVGASDSWIDAIARTGTLPAGATEWAERLTAGLRAALDSSPAPIVRSIGGPVGADWLPLLLARHGKVGQDLTAFRYTPARDCFFLGDDPLALVRAVPGLVELHIDAIEPWDPDRFEPFTCNIVIKGLATAPHDSVTAHFRTVSDQIVIVAVPVPVPVPVPVQPPEDPAPEDTTIRDAAASTAHPTLRINAGRVDAMVDIVGELVVAKNDLAHLIAPLIAQIAERSPQLANALTAGSSNMERLVGDLHRTVMGVRMVPLSRTLRRFPPLVRDIAARLGREVRFDVQGGEIEADRAIVDGLYEPLLHILRNALDHGIEPPDLRRRAGKPAVGRVTLHVRREAEQILIAVADDGAGIDPAQLRQVARARQVATAGAIDAMSDVGVLDLLFAPGFSTAAVITDISGRGVGMDSVRTAVTALGGTASIASQHGAGSTISLRLPQTIAITTLVIVRVGAERFGVPIDIVAETARVCRDDIVAVPGGAVFVLRDQTIPVLDLGNLLHLPHASRDSPFAKILIVQAGGERVGVVVDGLDDHTDLLLRPPSGLLAGAPGLLGTALLGDGQVLMVLNLPELIG